MRLTKKHLRKYVRIRRKYGWPVDLNGRVMRVRTATITFLIHDRVETDLARRDWEEVTDGHTHPAA